jgi:hypothetical protein
MNCRRVLLASTAFLVTLNFCSCRVPPAYCGDIQPIPITVDRGRTILPVKTGTSGTLDVILDSGMAFDGLLIYNRKLAKHLDLENAIEVLVPGAGDGDPAKALMLESASFFVGDVEVGNQKIIVLQSDVYDGFPSDGVLGYSILGHYAVELDYENGTMVLHDPEELDPGEGWISIPLYFRKNRIPWMDISVKIDREEPVELSVYIDFASGDIIELLEKDDMKFSLPKKTEKAYLGTGLSGDIYGSKGKISRLIIGPFQLKGVEAAFAPARVRSKQPSADGIIGGGCFQKFNVIFDYSGNRLLLKQIQG